MAEERIQEPPPKLRPGGAFLLVLIHLAGAMTVGLLAINLANDESIHLFIAAGVVVGPLIALYVGLNRYAPHRSTRAALRLDRPRGRRDWGLMGAALVAGVAMAPLVIQLTLWIFRTWPLEVRADAPPEPTGGGAQVILLVAYLFLSPVTQEALFRGLMLGGLRDSVGERRALFVTTVLYVAAVIQPHVMPVALVLSLVTGILALRSRSLWIPITAHITMRIVEAVLLWDEEWPTPTDPGTGDQPVWLLAVCGAVLVVVLVAAWRVKPGDGREADSH